MELVPGKMGQRGINLQDEKTPNMGNPQKTKTNKRRKIGHQQHFLAKDGKVVIYDHLLSSLTVFFLDQLTDFKSTN